MTDLPHNVEAEQMLLGALMSDPKAADRISGIVSSEHFWRELHGTIFAAIIDCGDEADALTVADWFAKRQMSGDVENGAYLTELAINSPGSSNAMGWARLIRQKADQRRMIELASEAADRAQQGEDVAEICEGLHSDLAAFDLKGGTGPRSLTQIAATWLDHLDELAEAKSRMETGLADVDRIVQGLLPGELIVLAGRPAMGKTAGLMSILQNVSGRTPALLFSCEMSGEQLLKRMVAGRGVHGSKFRNPQTMEVSDWQQVTAGLVKAKKRKLLIDDTGGISVNQIAARAREAKRRHGIGLVAVDYLQLVTCKAENRFQEVSLISRQLKKLAKDLGLPVIAVSQLSRGVETRQDKRPHMADLRESGQLEQDADVIVFLYRNGYYDKNDDSGITEWIVAKHRDAEPGTAYCRFNPGTASFVNADEDSISAYKNAMLPDAPGKQSRWQQRKGAA